MDNWRNVNNWHWIDKNCNVWSHEYLKQAFNGIRLCDDAKRLECTVASTNVEGDVDINQRKGKLLIFFDVAIDLQWTGLGV